MKTIKIYRNTGYETEICNVSAKQSIHKSAIKGLDEIQISVVIENPLDVQEGDYIKLNGINYTLNRDVEYTIESDVKYNYNLVFEHPFYILLNKLYCNRITGFTNFTLTGKLIDFVQLLTWCVNISSDNPDGVDTGWTIGDVVNTDYKNLSFSDLDCVAVLNKLDEEFGVEHFFNNKQINFVERIERLTDHVFEQGLGKGLYKITQQPVDKEDTVTRLIVRGGNKNTPFAYADEEGYLKLPENYLEDFSEHTKVVEKKKKFEEEFPHFEGSVATVSGDNNEVLTCPQIDFDLSAIAVGENARVNFLTGDLLGNSFEFAWDNSKKQITLIEKTDDTALPDAEGNKPSIPNSTKKTKVGDEFNFTGVLMPESYVVASIERLREKGNKYLNLFSKKRVKFTLDIDYRYMRGKPDLIVGDLVVISIPQRNFYQVIRITQLEKNLNSGALSATVSNYLEENWEKYVESRVNNVRNEILASQANVKNTLETIFKDGIVTESELAIIQSVLDRLRIERGQMNAQYLVVRGNINLANKTPLTNAWNYYQDAYTNISNAINTAIADRKITQAEAQDIEDKLASYSTELNNLTKAIEDARQAIEDKKVEAARLYVEYSATGTGGWHETFNPASDLYMRQKNGADGEWSAPARIVGEAGHAGKDGKYTEYQFAKNTSPTTAPTTGWQDAPPAVNADEYIWMRTREVVPPAAPGAWSPAARISGLRGEDVGSGKMLYKDPTFKAGVNNTSLYNNASDKSSTTWSRIAKPADAPTDSTHIMRYSYSGNPHPTPGFGGFYQHVSSRANAVLIQKIIAKIPVGRSINGASNSVGMGGSHNNWLTPRDGTGRYETYLRKIICGTSGSFSGSGHVFFEGGANEAFDVDVCYATIIDMTAYDDTADKALAQANKSAAVTDKFATTIDGGLIGTVMILLRELNSLQETAGLSGIQGELKNNPAFWSGGTYEQAFALIQFLSKMSAGTTPSSGEYDNLAKITLLHNGAAKVGDFIIEESGRITMIDPLTGKVRLMFSVQNLPLIADLMSGTVYSGTANIGAGSVSAVNTVDAKSQILSGSVNVTKNGARAQFGGTTITVNGIGSNGAATATLYALRNGQRYMTLGSAFISFPMGGSSSQTDTHIIAPYSISSIQSGLYTFELVVTKFGDVSGAGATSTSSSFSWNFTEQNVRYQQYGLDGFMSFYSNHHFHFTESKGLDVRGDVNMPGVLVSGRVASAGNIQYSWKISKLPTPTVRKTAVGKYTITHNIGHTNYVFVASPMFEDVTCVVESVDANTVTMRCYHVNASKFWDSGFAFTITGDNY